MHRDTRYKWKPIKGENHILLLLWCKGKLQIPLTTDFLQAPTYRRLLPQFCKLQLARKLQLPSIFCRHQPTGGSNLSQLQLTFYQATTWCGSTNSHLFSAGTNLQEAPTSVSYNWHLSSYNLIGKLQLPYSFKRKTLADLPWISALFCTFSSTIHRSSYLPCFISASSRILY